MPVLLDADAGADDEGLRGMPDAVLSENGYASTRALKHIASAEYPVHEVVGAGNRPRNRSV